MQSGSLLILSRKDVSDLLLDKEVEITEKVRRAYCLHEKGDTSVPASTFLRFPNRERERIIALPAYLGGEFEAAGIKWISSFPGNIAKGLERASALIVLNSVQTGLPEVLLEGSVISAKRTAASAALAASLLHHEPTSSPLGIVGCGVINYEIVRFLRSLSKAGLKTVFVYDSDRRRASQFVLRANDEFMDLAFEFAEDTNSVLERCRLISIATNAVQPHIFDVSRCCDGTTILHISLRDLSPDIILSSDNIVDDVDHVCRAQSSVHLAEQKSGNRDFITSTLASAIAAGGSRRSKSLSIFSPFGLGVLDLAVGTLVRELANELRRGMVIESFG